MKIKKIILGLVGISLFGGALFSTTNNRASKVVKADNVFDYSGLALEAAVVNTNNLDDPTNGLFYFLLKDTNGNNLFYCNGGTTGIYLNDHQDDLTNDGKSFTDYFYIGGRSFRSIVTDNQTGVTNYAHASQFPMTMGSVYAPISIVMCGDKADIAIDGNFIADIARSAHDFTIELKAGCPLIDSTGKGYNLPEDIVAIPPSNPGEPEHFASSSATSDLHVIDVAAKANDHNEPTFVIVLDKPLDEYVNQYILDHKVALSAYLTINGESIQEINKRIDDSTYDYSGMEVAGGIDPAVVFNKPIRLFVNSDMKSISCCVYPSLFTELFSEGQYVEFGVRKGFVYKSEGAMKRVDQDTSVMCAFSATNYLDRYFMPLKATQYLVGDIVPTTITASTTLTNLVREEDSNYFDFTFTASETLANISTFDLTDGNDSRGFNLSVLKNILINGVSIDTINSTTDVTGWDFSTSFPQNADALYHKPILVKVDGANINLQIHTKFAYTLAANSTISLNAGTRIIGASRTTDLASQVLSSYKVSETVTATLADTAARIDARYFVTNYMHMDYVDNLGYCNDSVHNYFGYAKAAYNALPEEAKALIKSDTEFAAAYTRLNAWATAANQTLEVTGSNSRGFVTFANETNTSIAFITFVAVSSLLAVAIIVLKKKHN